MVPSQLKQSDARHALPVLNVPSTQSPLDDRAISQLESLLPDYIRARRWYRAKTRTIESVRIESTLPLPGSKSYVVITQLHYEGGNADNYVLAIRFGDAAEGKRPGDGSDLIATYRTSAGEEGNVSDAIFDADFRKRLLEAFAEETQLAMNGGGLF